MKATGKQPGNLDKLKIQQEAVQDSKNEQSYGHARKTYRSK